HIAVRATFGRHIGNRRIRATAMPLCIVLDTVPSARLLFAYGNDEPTEFRLTRTMRHFLARGAFSGRAPMIGELWRPSRFDLKRTRRVDSSWGWFWNRGAFVACSRCVTSRRSCFVKAYKQRFARGTNSPRVSSGS
ncbi:unnamed protein product, partial [Sphacelaria rigidula]